MACKIHIEDIGTIFQVEIVDCAGVAIDIQSATVKQIKFKKPNGITVTHDAVFASGGTDGLLNYTVIAGDLDIVGEGWQIQGFVTLPTGEWHSDEGAFTVWEHL